LYSADRVTDLTGVPHWLQNFESGDNCVPQEEHDRPVVFNPTPLGPRQYGVTPDPPGKSYRPQSPDLDVRDLMARRWRV
jgi:hypothetical protein